MSQMLYPGRLRSRRGWRTCPGGPTDRLITDSREHVYYNTNSSVMISSGTDHLWFHTVYEAIRV